ncbi:MAG: type II CAAX endopeptidase family protein [Tissierellia bacterium]|nr:type II CAAX endopeptidase family protein [Tissierellia bacterium]
MDRLKINKAIVFSILVTIFSTLSLSLSRHLINKIQLGMLNDLIIFVVPLIIFICIYIKLKSEKSFIGDVKKSIIMSLPLIAVQAVFLFNIYLGIKNRSSISLKVLILIILVNLCVGFFEEIVYRGIIFSILLKKFRTKAAIFISSLFFGLAHFSNLVNNPKLINSTISQVIYAFMIGVFLCSIYINTKSLLGCCLIHFLVDFMSILLMNFYPATADVTADKTLIESIISIVIVLPSFIFGLLYIKKYRKKNIDTI